MKLFNLCWVMLYSKLSYEKNCICSMYPLFKIKCLIYEESMLYPVWQYTCVIGLACLCVVSSQCSLPASVVTQSYNTSTDRGTSLIHIRSIYMCLVCLCVCVQFVSPDGRTYSQTASRHSENANHPTEERKRPLRIQDRELQEMSDEGFCMSMHQPWATLLVTGIKK